MNMPTVKQRDSRYQILRARADGWGIEYMDKSSGRWYSINTICVVLKNSELRIVPDENDWLPWYATEESAVSDQIKDTMIDCILDNHNTLNYPLYAGGLRWNSSTSGEITHYRPNKERILVKIIHHYDDGSSEEA